LIGDPMWWNDVEKIVLKYAPVPAELTSLKSEIQLPDTAEEALVAACANFMAGRVPADVSPPIDRGYFLALANDAHASFLRQLATSTRVKATYTKEGWLDGDDGERPDPGRDRDEPPQRPRRDSLGRRTDRADRRSARRLHGRRGAREPPLLRRAPHGGLRRHRTRPDPACRRDSGPPSARRPGDSGLG